MTPVRQDQSAEWQTYNAGVAIDRFINKKNYTYVSSWTEGQYFYFQLYHQRHLFYFSAVRKLWFREMLCNVVLISACCVKLLLWYRRVIDVDSVTVWLSFDICTPRFMWISSIYGRILFTRIVRRCIFFVIVFRVNTMLRIRYTLR